MTTIGVAAAAGAGETASPCGACAPLPRRQPVKSSSPPHPLFGERFPFGPALMSAGHDDALLRSRARARGVNSRDRNGGNVGR